VTLSEQLSEPARQNRDDEETLGLRRRLEAHPRTVELQNWADEFGNDLPVFATFVLLADGLQIARHPVVTEESRRTFGRNNAWRAYYHGQAQDRPETWRASSEAERIQETYLSPPFVSQFTDEWVIAVTSPVRSEESGETVGIVGIMVRLGSLARLPGHAATSDASQQGWSHAVLIDSRPPNDGQVIQHPLYAQIVETATKEGMTRRQLRDQSREANLRSSLHDGDARADYRDPFGKVDSRFDHRWLAAQLPVDARGRHTGLSVIVQESYDDIIGQPLSQLRRGLVLLSLVTLALATAVIVPLWFVILRLVR
jgi:hypothetical protein